MSTYYLSVDPAGNVIMHHGVKGMKWYQHIFSAAKTVGTRIKERRQTKKLAKREQREQAAKRSALVSVDPTKMSDSDLKAAVSRLQLEKTYFDTRAAVLKATETQQSSGEKIMSGLKDQLAESLTNAAKKAVANTIENKVKEMIGGEGYQERQKKNTELEALKLDADIWSKKKEISNAKKAVNDAANPKKTSAESTKNDELRVKLSNKALDSMLKMIDKGSYDIDEFDRLANVAGYRNDNSNTKKKKKN